MKASRKDNKQLKRKLQKINRNQKRKSKNLNKKKKMKKKIAIASLIVIVIVKNAHLSCSLRLKCNISNGLSWAGVLVYYIFLLI